MSVWSWNFNTWEIQNLQAPKGRFRRHKVSLMLYKVMWKTTCLIFSPVFSLSDLLTTHTPFQNSVCGTLVHYRIPCEKSQIIWCGTMDQHSHTIGMTGSHSVPPYSGSRPGSKKHQKMNTYLSTLRVTGFFCFCTFIFKTYLNKKQI